MATAEELRSVLAGVIDPELGQDIVSLGMVRDVRLEPGGRAVVTVALTVAGCPLRGQIDGDVRARVLAVPGVESVEVVMGTMGPEERAALMARARWRARDSAPDTMVPPTARVLAISSGKGGVGKSSVTVNLATALARRGMTIGLLDADIWGFSIPRMLGIEEPIEARGGKMIPIERPVPDTGAGPGLLRVVSMGFISGSAEEEAVMWRGQILNRALQHFLEDVAWGDLDYLLVDMPPGTGDIQMGLARMLPRTDMLVVTTPALAAQKVAARAADMARRGYLRVAGVIENMSAFECDHGQTYALFGQGGGQRLAAEIGAPLLGSIPLDPSVAAGGDRGTPAVLAGGPVAAAFEAVAAQVATTVAPLIERSGCSARMLEHIEAALGPAG